MPKKINLVGKTFHMLTVVKESGRDKQGQVLWECQCQCGNTVVVRGRDLKTGNTKSCGCVNLEKPIERIRKNTVNHSNPSSIRSSKLSAANTSGHRGVCPTKTGKWRATIGYKGKQIYLGEYADIQDAIAARKAGEKEYFEPVLREINDKKDSQ